MVDSGSEPDQSLPVAPRQGSLFVGRQREMAELKAALIVVRRVSNILAKTGAANRTEAARYASQHGLAS